MQAGKLDRVIDIKRPTTTLDEYRAPVTTWELVATLRAQLLQYSMDDREGQRGNTTDTTIGFRCRWYDGLNLECQVSYQGEQYRIKQIKEIGRRVGLDILCERVGP